MQVANTYNGRNYIFLFLNPLRVTLQCAFASKWVFKLLFIWRVLRGLLFKQRHMVTQKWPIKGLRTEQEDIFSTSIRLGFLTGQLFKKASPVIIGNNVETLAKPTSKEFDTRDLYWQLFQFRIFARSIMLPENWKPEKKWKVTKKTKLIQWNLDLTKSLGTGQICWLNRGFVISKTSI